jgi:hypothetical protein
MAAVGLLVAGCGDDPEAAPTPDGTTSAPVGAVANCVVGDWRTTAVSGSAGGEAASASLSGGGGVALSVNRDGAATARFGDMQPVRFTVQIGDADAQGLFSYDGEVSTTIRATASDAEDVTPTASPATTGAGEESSPTATVTPTDSDATGESGTWEPVGDIDWGNLRLTVELTDPAQARLLDEAPIGDYLDDIARQTGNVVEPDPMLGPGRYTCAGDALTLSPDDDRGTTWTLERA